MIGGRSAGVAQRREALAVAEADGYSDEWEMAMKFKVALYPSEEGYSVNVPGLPGCWSQGATEEEALANIAEVIHE